MEDDYKFGANILENLTTGMYRDSRTIYREYIQNACDSIDNAIRESILSPDEAEIRIEIHAGKIRKIVIEDNGMGIPADKFRSTLGNIADSDKKIGDARGFRGIGRLCGLAYCEEVLFIAKYKGEEKESVLRCRSSEMRRMLNENAHGIKYSAVDVLRKINEFFDRQAEDPAQHFFRVELIGINEENRDLLNIEDIKTLRRLHMSRVSNCGQISKNMQRVSNTKSTSIESRSTNSRFSNSTQPISKRSSILMKLLILNVVNFGMATEI